MENLKTVGKEQENLPWQVVITACSNLKENKMEAIEWLYFFSKFVPLFLHIFCPTGLFQWTKTNCSWQSQMCSYLHYAAYLTVHVEVIRLIEANK